MLSLVGAVFGFPLADKATFFLLPVCEFGLLYSPWSIIIQRLNLKKVTPPAEKNFANFDKNNIRIYTEYKFQVMQLTTLIDLYYMLINQTNFL